jgi:hypothetical protein
VHDLNSKPNPKNEPSPGKQSNGAQQTLPILTIEPTPQLQSSRKLQTLLYNPRFSFQRRMQEELIQNGNTLRSAVLSLNRVCCVPNAPSEMAASQTLIHEIQFWNLEFAGWSRLLCNCPSLRPPSVPRARTSRALRLQSGCLASSRVLERRRPEFCTQKGANRVLHPCWTGSWSGEDTAVQRPQTTFLTIRKISTAV